MTDEFADHISAESLAALEAELHALETEGRSRRFATSPPRSPASFAMWMDGAVESGQDAAAEMPEVLANA